MPPNNPNEQLDNNPPQQPLPNQNINNQPVQNVNMPPNNNQIQDINLQQPNINQNQNVNISPQQLPNQTLNSNQAGYQNINTHNNYVNQPASQPTQYNQQITLNNNEHKPSFGIIALLILQIMYSTFSFMSIITLFSNNNNELLKLDVMLIVLFIIMTIGYAFLLFKIFLKKYWALMVYVGAMAVTATIEIKDVVAYNNIEWTYITSLVFSFTLFGLAVYLATIKKNIFK